MPSKNVALLLLLAFPPQSPTPSSQTQTARDTIRVQSNLVVLSVTVKDPTGHLISELKDTATVAQPSPPYIPPPVHTDPLSTTSPPLPVAPTYAGCGPSKALEDAPPRPR